MSSLLYVLQPDLCIVAMDTLCLNPFGRPIKFCSKFVVLPPQRTVLCVTGVQQVMLRWYAHVLEQMSARDIVVLDQFAPDVLRRAAAEIDIDALGMRATIYQLGYSHVREGMVGYAYRSTAEFVSEELEVPSVGFKPSDGLTQELVDAEVERLKSGEQQLEDMAINLFTLQKAYDDQLPPRGTVKDWHAEETRLGIGGEIHLLQMNAEAMVIRVIHRFPDADAAWADTLDYLEEMGSPIITVAT